MSNSRTPTYVYVIALMAMFAGLGLYIAFEKDPNQHTLSSDKENSKTASNKNDKGNVNKDKQQIANEPDKTHKVDMGNFRATQLIQKVLTGQKPIRPEFGMRDLQGKIRYIKEWDGKIVIINFWATWCPPCKREMPAFIDLYNKYKKNGVEIIGVAIDEKEAVKQFVDDIGVNYTILQGEYDALTINRQYGNIRGQLPYTVFINRKKQMIAVKQGEIKKEQMEKAILQLIGPANNSQTAVQQ